MVIINLIILKGIVTEFMDAGSLLSYLLSSEIIPESQMIEMLKEIAQGLLHVSSNCYLFLFFFKKIFFH